ncbi:LytS/YhcK type 5TM receptor domain-containing protein [Metabacillus sp. Hm71]|uniref:LytS/YhcK type 5TM receptor domain-containing protein n=1 Tax=Metabacillus sp. Hm71 TaxID=3450743 RepID=UPI003F43732A
MGDLTIILFERIGMLLIFAFMLTRIPSFRYLLDRELSVKTTIYHSIIFGILAIAGAQAGVKIADGQITSHIWVLQLAEGEMLVGSSLVAIVISGLFGGPYVGLGAGSIVAVYCYLLGGEHVLAVCLANMLSGLIAGYTARFFSHERVIASEKALFIGMFAPILHMAFLLIFTSTPEETIELVNTIGIPLVVTNSVAIAIFTAMIRIALNEKEQEAALETKRALKIAEETLPFLKRGLNFQTAAKIADLLREELKIPAVALTDTEKVLAHTGLGFDHHHHNQPIRSQLTRLAIETGEIQAAYGTEQIQCNNPDCPLQAAIIVPIRESGEVTGLIQLFFRRSQQIRAVEIAFAHGLGKLISNQLDAVAAEKMKTMVQEAELRHLQAQVNPHFLFNTLHVISALIQKNPGQARGLIVQLGQILRSSLKLSSASLITLNQESTYLHSYIEIMKARFSDQLAIEVDMENGVGAAMIPPFTLQPLVENCINHGLKNVSSGGMIWIKAKKKGNSVVIEIKDNGSGFPPTLISCLGSKPVQSEKGNGIAIYNVNQRLTTIIGETARLQFRNRSSGGSLITFTLSISVKGRDKK